VLEQQRAELVAALEPHVDAELITRTQRIAARLSVRLDASPLDDATADAVDRGALPPAPAVADQTSGKGWAQVLRLDGMPTQDIAAAEYRGVRTAQRDEARLARELFTAPVATVMQLQRHIAAGLVAPDRLGALRVTSQAVHDSARGMVVFHAPDPQRLPALLDELDAWVRGARDRHSALVVAGVVHLRILQWYPFEAGNGRVARAASRVALRATSGDPWGIAVPEREYARDPMRYVAEVAATNRRRSDLRPWIERTAEAVVASLEAVARELGVPPDDVPARGVHECQRLTPGETITIREYAASLGHDSQSAIVQLNRLCWAGLLTRDVGTHGLRYVRPHGDRVR
jgi:hypothetical protein